MEANQAMLKVAEFMARWYGFIEVSKHTINAERDSFWGNQYLGIKARLEGYTLEIQSCKYIYPQFEEEKDERKRRPKIEIDMHFGKPRLGIDLPDGTSCFLTYRDNICSEAQAFGDRGIALAQSVKEKIDYFINN